MKELFQNIPAHIVFFGNILISVIGALFVGGAPVKQQNKKLQWCFLLFWLMLSIYYFLRMETAISQNYALKSIYALYISKFYLTDLSITRISIPWLWLVIVADIPIIAIAFGYIRYILKIPGPVWLLLLILLGLYMGSWVISNQLQHNATSSLLAFFTFMCLAWSCRVEHISSSVLLITYALLHFPIGLFVHLPADWTQNVFVLLLISKLSLIIVMYDLLEVKVSKRGYHRIRKK